MAKKLLGKKILLTGALGTLGRAQSEKLASEGGELFLLDVQNHNKDGEDFAKQLSSKYQVSCAYLSQDLNQLEETRKVIGTLIQEIDGIDILINNAASIINKPFEKFSIEEYENMVRVNSSSGFALAQIVAPAMKKKKYGKIVNFTSITLNGRWGGFVPYVVSKGAYLGLTKGLARELGPYNINVNAVSPGAIQSEAENRVFGDKLQEYNDWILENQSLKFRGQPEDIAHLVLFLVSDEAKYISGQNICIDGGW